MALFGRGKNRTVGTRNAIESFWQWWGEAGAGQAEAGIANGGDYGPFVEDISRRVKEIHPDLEWELGRGQQAEHVLCVTGAGNSALRSTSERWFRAAPSANSIWEYSPARQADPSFGPQRLEIDGRVLVLSELRYSLDVREDELRIDFTCFHPEFQNMTEAARKRVGFLSLDWILGEDDVERWVGVVSARATPPVDGLPPDAVPAIVAALAERHREPQWAFMRGRDDRGRTLIATVRRPLRAIDFPLLDKHIAVTIKFDSADESGLPTSAALDQLRALEDELEAVLTERALFVGHETSGGRRLFHGYADAEDEGTIAQVRQWAAGRRSVSIDISDDPGWTAVRRFR